MDQNLDTISDDFRTALKLIKRGNKAAGRAVLARLLRQTPENEMAWLWLAETFDSDSQRIEALQHCLRYNPESQRTRKALQHLQDRLTAAEQPQIDQPESVPPSGRKTWLRVVVILVAIVILLAVLALLWFRYLS